MALNMTEDQLQRYEQMSGLHLEEVVHELTDEIRRLNRILSVENKEILARVRQIVEENGLPPASS